MATQPSGRRDGPGQGLVLDHGTRVELKRVTVLFLLSSITLVLVVVYAVARTVLLDVLKVEVVPDIIWLMWAVSMSCGFVASWFYGVYVTARARRWLWVALCALPPTAVPCAVAYAWIRRGELEYEIRGQGESADA